MSRALPIALETIDVVVSSHAVAVYAAAFETVCRSVGWFRGEGVDRWRVEGIKPRGEGEERLAAGLALAALTSGEAPALSRRATEASGWLARNRAAFPPLLIGRRFQLRPTHLPPREMPGRITLTLDAGLAFGSGEHGSTQGCLLALERLAPRRPARLLDLGTGSGVLAMAAARLFCRPMRATAVLASDLDPFSVRVARENAARNGLARRVRVVRCDGWLQRPLVGARPFDLVVANILARPLATMAGDLARHLAPGGTAILAGLLARQERGVLAAHRRQGLVLRARQPMGAWTTLILARPRR